MDTRQGWQKYRSRCQSGIYNFYFVEIGWSLDQVGGGNIFDSVPGALLEDQRQGSQDVHSPT